MDKISNRLVDDMDAFLMKHFEKNYSGLEAKQNWRRH